MASHVGPVGAGLGVGFGFGFGLGLGGKHDTDSEFILAALTHDEADQQATSAGAILPTQVFMQKVM